MKPEIDKYRPFVDHFDLPEAEKIELIHTLWRIMEGFADRAFGVNSAEGNRIAKFADRGRKVLTLKPCFGRNAGDLSTNKNKGTE